MNGNTFEQFGLSAPRAELLRNRVVSVIGPINMASATRAIEELLFLDSQDPGKPITMYLMGPGGEISPGLAVVDTCKRISSEVATVATGACCSMSAVLAICCAKPGGNRYITPLAELMLHQPLVGGLQGQASDIERASLHMLKTKQTLERLLSEASGLSIAKVRELCDRDTWLDAEQSKALGLMDEILEYRD